MNKKQDNEWPLYNLHTYGLDYERREIFLHGNISESSEYASIDHIIFSNFTKNLRALEHVSSDPIIIHQFTIGGDWCAGMGIYDAIRNSPCKFLFLCHGCAMSMGSIIPQAVLGKGLRVSYPHCDWLIHDGSSTASGTLKQFDSLAKYNKDITDISNKIYVDAMSTGSLFTNKPKSKILKYLRDRMNLHEDWYLFSSDAVEHGFADAVFGSPGFKSIAEMISKL